ncbi:unnamed protein product [Cyclocybe aegerita]|uniref:Uncharacterized protein n=1 Tax=Cyclocybe aegerita TaxID=1973307 RepID=A0A8S0WK84_CYCAE|nr:unnamed protein product [Cyclocybe aegerita]
MYGCRCWVLVDESIGTTVPEEWKQSMTVDLCLLEEAAILPRSIFRRGYLYLLLLKTNPTGPRYRVDKIFMTPSSCLS